MTPEQLAEIKARVEATPRGPWHVEYFGDKGYPQGVGNDAAILVAETYEGGTGLRPTPEFIAHAREDIPALIAEVERLRKQLDGPCGSCHPCTNYRDETWRAAGRKPPHVHEWDELNGRIRAALDLIADHDGPEAQHSEHWKWVSVREALTGGEAG